MRSNEALLSGQRWVVGCETSRERAELGPGAGNRSGDPSDRAKIFVMERKGKPSGAVRQAGIQYGLAQGIVRQKG